MFSCLYPFLFSSFTTNYKMYNLNLYYGYYFKHLWVSITVVSSSLFMSLCIW